MSFLQWTSNWIIWLLSLAGSTSPGWTEPGSCSSLTSFLQWTSKWIIWLLSLAGSTSPGWTEPGGCSGLTSFLPWKSNWIIWLLSLAGSTSPGWTEPGSCSSLTSFRSGHQSELYGYSRWLVVHLQVGQEQAAVQAWRLFCNGNQTELYDYSRWLVVHLQVGQDQPVIQGWLLSLSGRKNCSHTHTQMRDCACLALSVCICSELVKEQEEWVKMLVGMVKWNNCNSCWCSLWIILMSDVFCSFHCWLAMCVWRHLIFLFNISFKWTAKFLRWIEQH